MFKQEMDFNKMLPQSWKQALICNITPYAAVLRFPLLEIRSPAKTSEKRLKNQKFTGCFH